MILYMLLPPGQTGAFFHGAPEWIQQEIRGALEAAAFGFEMEDGSW